MRPRMCCLSSMADRYINWPPPVEALFPLVKALARAQAKADFEREQAFLRSGRHLRRTFSPVDPEDLPGNPAANGFGHDRP